MGPRGRSRGPRGGPGCVSSGAGRVLWRTDGKPRETCFVDCWSSGSVCMADDRREPPPPASRAEPRQARGFFKALGAGIITGAADDDPSAIGTYASAGARFGLSFL